MVEFKNKNDYSVIVFMPDRVLKYTYVHSLFKFSQYLNRSFPDWLYMNVYVRRSGRFLKRYYKGQYIENKLK